MMNKRTKFFAQHITTSWPARALSLGAAIILYFLVGLTNLEERYITVPIQVILSEQLVVGQEYASFARVYLRGEPNDVFAVLEDDIKVSADFSLYERPGIFRVALRHQFLGGDEVKESLEIRLEPGILTLNLVEKVLMEVEVLATITDNPAAGYQLMSYTVIPPRVMISGPRATVENITEVRTQPIDLSANNNSFTSRVALTQPHSLVVFESTSLVEFRAEINESILVSTFDDIPISITGLLPGLRAELDNVRGSIRVQASQSLINQTNAETIGLLIDGGSIIVPGDYTLPVRPIVPQGFVVFRFDPVELIVTVEEKK